VRLATPAKTRRDSLLRASASAQSESAADPSVSSCHAKKEQAFRLMLWNVRELGGGFYMPPERHDHCVGACAALLEKLAPDICIVTGLRRTDGVRVADAGAYLTLVDAVAHTGASELARILTELSTRDAASDWQVAYPLDGNGAPLYDGGVTTAFLYRAALPCAAKAVAFFPAPDAQALGVGATLVHATFDLTPQAGKPMTIDLVTALGAAGEAAQVVFGSAPPAFVAAFSTDADLSESRAGLDRLRGALGGAARAPLANATVPRPPFWRATADRNERLLDECTGINAADVRLADGSMHWEALEPPEHPASAPMVEIGRAHV